MTPPTASGLDALPLAELEALYDAGAVAVAALERLAARGLNPVTAALQGAQAVEEWAHYPDGDARGDGARYYYHAHDPEELGENEHGHFHVFLEPAPGDTDAAPSHVVGLAMDSSGRLLRLFTTNGWVTGESWRAGDAIAAELDRFAIATDAARADLDLWLSSVVRLYRPRIARLLRLRDAALQDMRARRPSEDALEDRSVRVLSEAPVDLPADLRRLEDAIERATQA